LQCHGGYRGDQDGGGDASVPILLATVQQLGPSLRMRLCLKRVAGAPDGGWPAGKPQIDKLHTAATVDLDRYRIGVI